MAGVEFPAGFYWVNQIIAGKICVHSSHETETAALHAAKRLAAREPFRVVMWSWDGDVLYDSTEPTMHDR